MVSDSKSPTISSPIGNVRQVSLGFKISFKCQNFFFKNFL